MGGNNTFMQLVDVKGWTVNKAENIHGQKDRDGRQMREIQIVRLLFRRDICQNLKLPILGTELSNHLDACGKLTLILNLFHKT